jgi:hypothetical protein
VSTTEQTLVLLALAIALTIVVGRILLVAGQPFLEEVFRDAAVARSVNRLLAVLFHLITLGVLAIISTVEVPVDGVLNTLVTKTGIILLIVGIAYGISMLVLVRIRERRRAAEISERVQDRLADRGVSTAPAPSLPAQMPVPGQVPGPPGPIAPPPADARIAPADRRGH